MTTHVRAQINGYLVGPFWRPTDVEWFKDFSWNIELERTRFPKRPDFRFLLAHLARDGDFQSTKIAQGRVVLTATRAGPNGDIISRTRIIPLHYFPSVADYCHPDPDWSPGYPDDDE